jgi:hypothetical protein
MKLISPSGTTIIGVRHVMSRVATITDDISQSLQRAGFDINYKVEEETRWGMEHPRIEPITGQRLFVDQNGTEFRENTVRLAYDSGEIVQSAQMLEALYARQPDQQHPVYTKGIWAQAVMYAGWLCGYWEWVSQMVEHETRES